MAQSCWSSTCKAKAGGFLGHRGQPELHWELQANLGYVVRPCLKKIKDQKLSTLPPHIHPLRASFVFTFQSNVSLG